MKTELNYLSIKKNVKNLLLMSMTVLTLSCANESEDLDNLASQEISSIQYFDSRESFESKMKSIEITNEQLYDKDYNILSNVLNEDNIIGIGDYLIKVDTDSESVYTLKKDFLNEYNDLATMNLKNSNINQLSVYEDVLSVLDGSTTAQKSNCGSPASYDYDSDSTSGNNRSLSLSATYKASGIYFILSYRCIPDNSDSGYARLDEWDITYTTTSCVSYSSYGENDYGDGENEGSFGGTPYLGTTPLRSFHCFVVCSSSAGTVDVIIES